jgi:hypothetical protein
VTSIRSWPTHLRWFAAAFVLVGLAGYAAGLVFVAQNTGMAPAGVADHYHGNEDAMKFGKSSGEMLEIVHTHLLGMGVLFFAVGGLFAFSTTGARLKQILMIETMLSLLTTFGGLALVSAGHRAWLWLVYPSSVLMVLGYVVMSIVILWHCLIPARSRT